MFTIEDYFNIESLEDNKDDIKEGGERPLSPLRPKLELEELISEKICKATEITVTFKPELETRWSDVPLKHITERVLRKCMIRFPKTSVICLIGEHSRVGRLHYHGVFWGIPNDKVSRLKRACTRDLGRTEIKMISFPESYLKYMFKAYASLSEYPEEWTIASYICINI